MITLLLPPILLEKKKRGSFFSSSLACSYIIALLKLYCFKLAGGKIPLLFVLSKLKYIGKEKNSKSSEVFSHLLLFAGTLKKKVYCVTSFSLLALVFLLLTFAEALGTVLLP